MNAFALFDNSRMYLYLLTLREDLPCLRGYFSDNVVLGSFLLCFNSS